MRPALLAVVAMVAMCGVACAEGWPPDFSHMPVYHPRHDGTLACGSAQALLYIRSEVGAGPVDRTRFSMEAQRVCSTLPKRVAIKLWHEFKYVGFSGQADGPQIMQMVLNDNLVMFVMKDDVTLASR